MEVRLVGNTKYHQCPNVYRKGDIFEIPDVAFVPLIMEDLTPKPAVAIKTAPKVEDVPKVEEVVQVENMPKVEKVEKAEKKKK